ncbi:hypothetical protein Tco_0353110 [Tanacetum coccineum]
MGWPMRVEEDLKVLEENPMDHQEKDCLVEEKVCFLKKVVKNVVLTQKDEVVPKVEDVSLVDGVFDGAFGGDGDEDFAIG